jgi:hypothetical protein
MHEFSPISAARALERLELCPVNQRLARYWLSICRERRLPTRSDFDPAKVKAKLPGLAIFEINRSGTVVARIAGTAIDRGLGFPLAGHDFVAVLPENQRHVRITRLQKVVSGFAGVARTSYRTCGRPEAIQENLLLPFGGLSESGSQQFLLHTNVRPTIEDMVEKPESWDLGLPERYEEISLA